MQLAQDLEGLLRQMAATLERAKAEAEDDSRELRKQLSVARKRIADIEKAGQVGGCEALTKAAYERGYKKGVAEARKLEKLFVRVSARLGTHIAGLEKAVNSTLEELFEHPVLTLTPEEVEAEARSKESP